MSDSLLLHIFDAITRDQRVLRATEEEVEVEYISGDESEDDEFRGRAKNHADGRADNREMIINLFGSTADGRAVRVEVNGFQPFFYVRLPNCANTSEEIRLKSKIEQSICAKFPGQASSLQFQLVHKKVLYGYTGGKTFPFVKITMPSLGAFYNVRKFVQDGKGAVVKLPTGLKLYESNIDPMLRFFHIRNLQPCGWIRLDSAEVDEEDPLLLKARVEWTNVHPATGPVVSAPFHHAFWDVECYSHDGEFPVAQQGYRRVAKQLWANASTAEDVPQLLRDAFAGAGSVKIPSLQKPAYAPKAQEIATITENAKVKEELEEIWSGRETANGKQKEEKMQNLTKLLDRMFGRIAPLAGDPIIQIGTVSWKTGDAAGKKHIFVLGGCDEIPGVTVHSCKTEKDLLLQWFHWVVEQNFDVFVGYNIFGFDERYVWERLVELGLDQEDCVQAVCRTFDEGGVMELKEKFLSSSALGDNTLYMWNTTGRLRIDLMGHIKRKSQMPSYKLDSVAAAFLSGKLSAVCATEEKGHWLLKTKQKGDARVGRYVQVLDELGEDLTEKMQIVEITADGLIVESEEELSAIAGEAARWAVVKDDVPPKEIFRLHRGSDTDRAKVAAYCVQDCDLTLELYRKLEVFNEAMSMANVCSVPVSYIFTRGQGIKIESLIFKDCMMADQLIEVLPQSLYKGSGGEEQEDSYEGAIVLDPEPGFYTDAPVGVCDFASLYPSTIISENISHDMLVWAKDYDNDGNLVKVSYGSIEAELHAPAGTAFTDIEFDIWRPDPADTRKHPKKIKVGIRLCRYAQPAGNVKGSLPTIVAKLLATRKAKRNEMAKTDDPFKKALLDAEQNAYKVTANSLYGQLGSATFKIRLQHLAASTTAYGRKQILFAKDAIEEFYGPSAKDPRCEASGAKIVYGDSVTGDTAVYVQKDGIAKIQRMDSLVNPDEWKIWHETKEAIELPADSSFRIWTERGWTPVRRIIRHRLAPGKKMFRILTHTGVVDCTEDHSLVLANGEECKPSDVKVGTALLHNFEIHNEFTNNMSTFEIKKDEAWAMGFFLADGSADVYDCPSGMKATWAINKADTELLNKAASKLPFPTKILDTLESSGVYKLVPVGDIKTQAIRYRQLFYNSAHEKRIPTCILNAPLEIAEEFMKGFYEGDGDKANGFGYVRWDQKGKEVCSGLYILARRLGYNVSVNDRVGKESVFRLTLTHGAQRKDPTKIKKIRELSTEGVEYVYDLETENHHFAVGPGALVVHNTDSLFVCFNPKNPETGERLKGREAIVKTIELTEEAGKFITGALKAPHDFEYDKVFYPFIIFSKKRYVGNKYEDSPDEFKETSMGIVLKRRDNAPLLKMCYGAAIDRLLNHRDIPGAVQCVKQYVQQLVDGKMKLSQLTITKSLRAEYAHTPPAHKMLAERMAIRDPGNAPASGDRIGYVYIRPTVGQEASKLQGDRIETPQYIQEKGLQTDAEYYIEHQLMNPLSQLFALMLEYIPGYEPPRTWSEDPDKRIAQREILAGQLLFKEGLAACRQLATRAFFKMMGVSSTTVSSSNAAPLHVAKPRISSAAKSTVVTAKQSTLQSYFRESAIVEDARLVKEMKAIKSARKKASKKTDE
jgi:DNA polymerase elongation subunit (family B)